MKQFYTYLHCLPDGTPFYVGKGHGKRCREMTSGRNKGHHSVTDLIGRENVLVYVFSCDSEEEALSDEIIQIAHLKAEGYWLANRCGGGQGVSGRKQTPEEIARRVLANTGKKRTPETCRRISEANRGKKRSDEFRAKMSEASRGNTNQLGKKRSDESRKKMSESASSAWLDPALREKMTAGRKGRPWSEERRKRFDSRSPTPCSDATKEKLSAAIAEVWRKRKAQRAIDMP